VVQSVPVPPHPKFHPAAPADDDDDGDGDEDAGDKEEEEVEEEKDLEQDQNETNAIPIRDINVTEGGWSEFRFGFESMSWGWYIRTSPLYAGAIIYTQALAPSPCVHTI